jgi:hypothetical protein
MARPVLHVAPGDDAPKRSGASSGVFAGRLPVRHARPALDPYAMHRNFPAIWAQYLRETFDGDRALICLTFRVDDRTVRSWLDGLNAPKGSVVALAAVLTPGFADMMRAAA